MKPGESHKNGIEQLVGCWRRLLQLLRSHPAVQAWDLQRLYVRNAYARFPGLRRTMHFCWSEAFLLWAISNLLRDHLPWLLRGLLLALWMVWFVVAYHLYRLDAEVMVYYRQAAQRSRFFHRAALKQTRHRS